MDAVTAFLYMNGYGIYVWPAFAAAAIVLGWMAWATLRRLRAQERALEALQGGRRDRRGNRHTHRRPAARPDNGRAELSPDLTRTRS